MDNSITTAEAQVDSWANVRHARAAQVLKMSLETCLHASAGNPANLHAGQHLYFVLYFIFYFSYILYTFKKMKKREDGSVI